MGPREEELNHFAGSARVAWLCPPLRLMWPDRSFAPPAHSPAIRATIPVIVDERGSL